VRLKIKIFESQIIMSLYAYIATVAGLNEYPDINLKAIVSSTTMLI